MEWRWIRTLLDRVDLPRNYYICNASKNQMQSEENAYYIKGISTGDNQVLLRIYKEFMPVVKRRIKQHNGSGEDAEDIFNQVLMQLYGRFKVRDFEIQTTFENYLVIACLNTWKKELKKRIRERVTKEEYSVHLSEAIDFSKGIREMEIWELYEEKFKLLSENCREILKLYLKKISGREIMEELGYASETTVRQRVFKCKSSLIKAIRSDWRFKENEDGI